MVKVGDNDKFLNGTKKRYVTLSSGDLKVIRWYVGASFSVLPYFNSHTVLFITMVQVVMQSVSRKHKLHTNISTEAELVDVDDASA